jgi:Coenzyme PQQ synthesis protein D (PqqD)
MPTAEIYLAKSNDIAARTLGDETIIMSTLDSTIFMLNPTGTAIWQAADGNTPLSRIIEDKVCAEFDVPVEQASADAMQFVEELTEHGILVVSDRPIPQEVP